MTISNWVTGLLVSYFSEKRERLGVHMATLTVCHVLLQLYTPLKIYFQPSRTKFFFNHLPTNSLIASSQLSNLDIFEYFFPLLTVAYTRNEHTIRS